MRLVKFTLPRHLEAGQPIFVNPDHILSVRQRIIDPAPETKAKKVTVTALVSAAGNEFFVAESVSEVVRLLSDVASPAD